jgi:Hypoxia induced protein conserved region
MAGIKMRQGDSRKFNYWLRGRVIMQGVTIGAMVWTLYGEGKALAEKERKASQERDAFERRMKMAEEAHWSEVKQGLAMDASANGEGGVARERKGGWWPWGGS